MDNVKKVSEIYGQPIILKESRKSVKKVFEDKKNFMHNLEATAYAFIDGSVVERRGAAVATSSASTKGCNRSQKQDADLSLMLVEPSDAAAMDLYQIDGSNTRECCSEGIDKPDWCVWSEMSDREFDFEDFDMVGRSFSSDEDMYDCFFNDTQPSPEGLELISGMVGRSFSSDEDMNDSFFNFTQTSPEGLELMHPLPLFDSILEGPDYEETVQFELPELPELNEMLKEDLFNFGRSSP